MICNVVPLVQGFKRIRSGVDSGAWYNEWFVRGSPHEMKNMVRVKIKGNANANNSTDGSSGGEDDDNLDGDPPDFYAMASQPKPGNMKTAMKPCSSSKMEFKSGDQEAIPEHAYLHSNSFLAPGMVSSTPSPAPQKLRRHTTCVEAMSFSSSMHPHSTSHSDLIQQQRRQSTMIGIGEVLYSSMIYQQSTADSDLIQQQRRHSMIGEVPYSSMYQQSTSDSDLIQQQRRHGTMIGEVPSPSMYQQSNHNLPSRMMVPSNNSMMLSDHHRNMNLTSDKQSPMSVPSAQMAHSSSTATFRRSTSFEPLPFGNGDDLYENLSFDNEEEKDPPDEFSQFIDNAIHKTE